MNLENIKRYCYLLANIVNVKRLPVYCVKCEVQEICFTVLILSPHVIFVVLHWKILYV